VTRALNPALLAWPSEEDAASDSLEANHDYMDLRGLDWAEAERILHIERGVVGRLLAAGDAELEWEAVRAELSAAAEHVSDLIEGPLYGLEPGTAAAVAALSALGAIPFWSDGGGIHRGHSASASPQVRFFALPEHVAALLVAAEAADVHIEPDGGRCVVRADDAQGLMDFAAALSGAQ